MKKKFLCSKFESFEIRLKSKDLDFKGEVSHSLFHGEFSFPGDFFSCDDAGLDEEEDARDILEDDTDEAEAERPGEVVVLPVGHKISAVGQGAEDDQSYRSKGP